MLEAILNATPKLSLGRFFGCFLLNIVTNFVTAFQELFVIYGLAMHVFNFHPWLILSAKICKPKTLEVQF